LSSQLTAVPVHAPFWHDLFVAHMLESVHCVPLVTFVCWHPFVASQVSVVHTLLSSQLTGAPAVQVPPWQVHCALQVVLPGHCVPLAFLVSGGQAAAVPLHIVALSQESVAAWHWTVLGWNWQVDEQQSVAVPLAALSSHCSPSCTVPSPHLATWVVAVALLLDDTASNWSAVTVAVLVSVPAVAGAVTAMVNEAFAPSASDGKVQVTVPPVGAGQVHPVPAALTKVTPAGSGSVTEMFVAVLGPMLLTVTV
jgi:hypothetical protein